jgi:hypothetical protein
MPRENFTHKMVNGVRVDLDPNSAEVDALVKAEEDWAAGAAARAWAGLRSEREGKLAATDWRASSDLTLAENWKIYRQKLRDITKNYTDETVQGDITWPSEPS